MAKQYEGSGGRGERNRKRVVDRRKVEEEKEPKGMREHREKERQKNQIK